MSNADPKEEIFSKLIEILIHDFKIDHLVQETNTFDDDIINNIKLDSLDTMGLVLMIQDEFNIVIYENEYNKLSSLKSIVSLIEEKIINKK